MDLRRLEHFEAIARLLSFHRAAEQLHISQSALSRSIQCLERQYRVRLFDRDRSGVQLTSVGQHLLDAASNLLYNAASLDEMLRGAAAGRDGRVAFGAGPIIGAALLGSLLAEVHGEAPKLAIHVVIDTAEALVQQLLDGELDFFLGIAQAPHFHERCTVEPFATATPLFLVRPGHPLLTRPGPVSFDDLRSFTKVSVSAWNQALTQADLDFDPASLRATIELDSYELVADFTEQTDAVFVGAYRVGDRLRRLELDGMPVPGSTIGLFTLTGRTLSPAATLVYGRLSSRICSLSDQSDDPAGRR